MHATRAGTAAYSVIPCINWEPRGGRRLREADGHMLDREPDRVESFHGLGAQPLALGIRDGAVGGARQALERWLYELEVRRRSLSDATARANARRFLGCGLR